MAHIILMPQLGISEESAILTAWRVGQGDPVTPGDVLFSIETGKSSFDVESEHTGTVLALLASEGDEVAVKAPVCAVGQPGEEFITPAQSISPRAKMLAEKLGVDPALAVPTGPEGRVIERDVRQITENREQRTDRDEEAKETGYADQPLSNMRKIIAKNMLQSLQNTAQLTHTASFDATRLLALKKDHGLNSMILYAVCRVLPDFPALNAWLLDDTLRVFTAVNLAVAVDTERGLMVPVVSGASSLTLPELSAEVKTLAEQCRTGSIPPEKLSGGSFTVSNLGSFGIESFTPILNPPHTGILGVNTITTRVKPDGAPYPAMALSLTYDHRALDGAPASRFLQALCKYLEDFPYDL